MSTPHTGQRDPPPAPRPLPGGESQSCGWWERPTDPWQVREGQGGMAGLLVSRKGVIAEEKAEQPPENQAGTASVSLLLREPRAAVAALALEGARETPTGLLTPHWESPPPRGQRPSLPPAPDMQGWTHQGDPEIPVLMGTNNVEEEQESGDCEAGHGHEQDPALDQGDGHLGQEDENPHQPPKGLQREGDRVTVRPGGPGPSGHTGEPGPFTNVNSVNPHTEPFVKWAN